MLALAALPLAACLVAPVGGQPEPGREQFVFTVRPGAGQGPEAERVFDGVGLRDAAEAVDHLAWAATPLGRVDFFQFTQDGLACSSVAMAEGAAIGCGQGAPPADEAVLVGGWNGDEWAVVEIQAGPRVGRVVATAADGTVYRSNVVRGRGVVVYPVARGNLAVQALGGGGAPVGGVATFNPGSG